MILRSLFCITVVAAAAMQIDWNEREEDSRKVDLINGKISDSCSIDFLKPLPGYFRGIEEGRGENGNVKRDTNQVIRSIKQ